MNKAAVHVSAVVLTALLSTAVMADSAIHRDYEVMHAPAMLAKKAPQAVLTEITRTDTRTIAVGDYGLIIFRDAAQSAWQQAEVPTSIFFTGIDFADADHGWAVGHHGVIVATIDGGKTWQLQLDGFQYVEQQKAHFSQLVAALEEQLENFDGSEDEEEELLFALDDASFQLENAELALTEGPTKPFLDVHAVSNDDVYVVGAYGSMLRSQDGGKHWDILDERIENPDGYHLNTVISDDHYLYVAGEAGQVFRSADAGESWELLDSPYNGSFFASYVDKQQQLWLVGLRCNIFVSADQGDSFERIRLEDNVNINAVVDAPQGGVYLVGNAGVIGWVDANRNVMQMTHPSAAALSGVMTDADGRLLAVGQRGVIEIDDFQRAVHEQE